MKPLIRTFSIAAIALCVDGLSKTWAVQNVKGRMITVIPNFMDLLVGFNHGGSFGISRSFLDFALCFPPLLGAGAVAWMWQRQRSGLPLSKLDEFAIGLFLGGMLANFAERVVYGSVTDFIHLSIFPVWIFNIADVVIDIGFVLFMCSMVWRWCTRRRPPTEATTFE